MKFGVVLGTRDPETAWNAFRFGVASLNAGHHVTVFLINSGVEAEGIASEKYAVQQQIELFVKSNGKILACGTCLKSRQKEGTPTCPISSMNELVKLVEESDRVLSFG